MRVSILSPDLSINCLGRAYLLAQLLERNYEVEIIGPKTRGDIWEPVREEYDYRGVETSLRTHRFLLDAPDLLNYITGDVVYASKPRLASYGIGLYERLQRDIPLVLDIDDWECGLIYGRRRNRLSTLIWGLPALAHHNSFYYTRSLEALSTLADARTVSNSYLKRRFGGITIPHARDVEKFDPDDYDQTAVREKFGLPADTSLVLFSGTPRPHKGVTDLVEAVAGIDGDIKTLVVGADESEYTDRIQAIGRDSILVRGPQQFADIPAWIAAADVVAVPQRETPSTRGQIPAKVFDAMAMAKPIIATSVNDLPQVLNRCGRIVPPNSPTALRTEILELLAQPSTCTELGRAARQRCIERYSYDALAPVLADVIESVAK